jgi:hypothetical protein
MNVLILSLLAVVSTVGSVPAFDQKPAGNPTRIHACTILTPDVVAKFTTATKIKVESAPTEAPIGVNGSQCDYSGIALHIDPFATVTADRMRKSPDREWAPISGVGETAYFHNVKDAFAEMFVWTGAHHFGILADVPAGTTAEQLKPAMIQVANLVAAKLK